VIVFLLDVNVLIALLDPDHVYHDAAHHWFGETGKTGWATCPITEAAVPRILGNPRYPNARGTPAAIIPYLRDLCMHSGHVFWPDDISILDDKRIDATRLLDFGQITDSYLLALAVAHSGRFATFDRRLTTDAVPNGKAHLTVIS
jgi:toxin-antitoxin system PIN domain toxin